MNPFFSIIIPTYNRANFIAKTVQSVLEQTFSDFEIIIIDDGSTDNTEEVIKSISDNRIKYIYIKNAERAAARNYGCKLALGEYVTFFDSDDLLYDIHLTVADKIIKANKGIEVFHLGYDIKNDDGKIIKKVNNLGTTVNKGLISGNILSRNGIFINKKSAIQNPFNTDRKLSALEDWELWLRLATQYPIYCFNKVTSSIINHDNRSVLQTDKQQLIQRFEALLKYILTNEKVVSYYRKDIRKFKASCYSYIALHLSLTKQNRVSVLKYLMMSMKENPALIFQRRFLAIVKHFI